MLKFQPKNLTANFIENKIGYQPKNIFSSSNSELPKRNVKLGLNWAKLKFSLVRVDNEVTVVFNSV